jgi:hypothetical protein
MAYLKLRPQYIALALPLPLLPAVHNFVAKVEWHPYAVALPAEDGEHPQDEPEREFPIRSAQSAAAVIFVGTQMHETTAALLPVLG